MTTHEDELAALDDAAGPSEITSAPRYIHTHIHTYIHTNTHTYIYIYNALIHIQALIVSAPIHTR